MAKSNKVNTSEGLTVVTTADYERLENAKSIITECQLQSDGLAERIAGQLFVVNEKKLYELDDCKTTAEWADKFFDISKGTVSDAINTFKRFGDLDKKDEIRPEYKAYAFSSLMRMKSLTDEQIELANINPTMSRKQITEAIKGLAVLEEKKAQLPKLIKEWSETLSKLNTIFDASACVTFIEDIAPNFYDKEVENTVEVYEDLIGTGLSYIEAYTKWDDIQLSVLEHVFDNDKNAFVEWCANVLEMTVSDFNSLPYIGIPELGSLTEYGTRRLSEISSGYDTVESEDAVQDAQDDTEDVQDDIPEDAPHTMPTLEIKVSEYMTGEKLNMKEILARLKEELPKVVANELEIIIR